MRKVVLCTCIVLLSASLTRCSTETENSVNSVSSQSTATNVDVKEEVDEDMKSEDEAILEVYEAIQQAMIDKDIETLDALIKNGTIFIHMSGKQQTKEEFFGEIADGTLNYFAYELHDPVITVDGDKAVLTGSNTLTAKVYGASGAWTLPVNAHFEKINGSWISCNE